MAKQPPRTRPPESTTDAAAQPVKPRRTRAAGATRGPQASRDASTTATRTEAMASSPSAEDIRMRAYQRFLDRGGAHGMDFEDWLEAERELKGKP
jgi:hypothetical protein